MSRIAQLVRSRISRAQDPKAMTPSENTMKRATPCTKHFFLHFYSVACNYPRKETLCYLYLYFISGGKEEGP